jgi:hypothetical protein
MATRQWAVTASGTFDFGDAANWTFGATPGVADIAQFNTGATDTITGSATLAELLFTSGAYALSESPMSIPGSLPSSAMSGVRIEYLRECVNAFRGNLR